MMISFRHSALFFILISIAFLATPLCAWEVIPTELTGTESQSVDFDIVVEAEDWDAAGTLCDETTWNYEFQLDGTLVDGTAEWGVDLSSPFVGGALTRICSLDDEELITPYTISMIEDFNPEETEEAEIFFEHCEAQTEGALICTDETLVVEVVEVAGGGLPEVGVAEVSDAMEPITDGRFEVFTFAPAPDGGVTVRLHYGGTALAGSDYVPLPTSVFIPEGSEEVFLDVEVLNDEINEGTETILVTVLESTDYTVAYQFERATILIGDDDGDGEGVTINQGMSDAWFNPATDGQGFFIIVFPEIGKVFMAWFTYDTQRPPANVQAILGDPGARWMTAFGDFAGNTAVLDIEFTTGGVFNTVPPQTSQSNDGTFVVEFLDCEHALVHYNIPSLGLSGTVPIQRLTLDNAGLCESQNQASK